MPNPSSTSVALLAHDRPDAIVAFLAGVPVDARRYLADVRALADRLPAVPHVLNACGDRYPFAVGFGAALLRGQRTLLPANHAPATLARLADDHPGLVGLIDITAPPLTIPTLNVGCDGRSDVGAFEVPVVDADRVAAVLFTSGTTGEPVPTAKTWGSLVMSARSEAAALSLPTTQGLAILGTVPPQHSYGLESTILLPLMNGLAFESGRPFFPADIAAALAALPRPRMLVTTPVHLRALCDTGMPLPPVDLVLSATAPLTPSLAADVEQRFAAPLKEIYGCSEAGQLATRHLLAATPWRLMRDVTLRQDERGTWASGGHVPGEILLADVIELLDRDRFLLHGRTADLVNIAGKRTSLAHLEQQLIGVDGVHDAAFLVPDDQAGPVARLVAFAVAPGRSSQELLAALRQRIDAAFLPRPLHVIDALPRNATGKIPRETLLALAARLRGGRAAE